MRRAAIINPVRTPVGAFGGALRPVPVETLGGIVARCYALTLSADSALALQDDNDRVVVGGEILANRGALVESDFDHCDGHNILRRRGQPALTRPRKPESPPLAVAEQETASPARSW
jgi:hypothetical protein